jgi:ribosomal protein S18 acetylase RimI-like enzyme
MESARLGVAGDTARLAELWEEAGAELGPQRGGALLLRSASFPGADGDAQAVLVVGAIDDVVVGFGFGRVDQLGTHHPAFGLERGAGGDRLGVIEVLYVEPGGRGIGVGEAMLEVMVGRFTELGCLGFDASALPGNREAKAFFETQGFVTRLLVMHRPGSPTGGAVTGAGPT